MKSVAEMHASSLVLCSILRLKDKMLFLRSSPKHTERVDNRVLPTLEGVRGALGVAVLHRPSYVKVT